MIFFNFIPQIIPNSGTKHGNNAWEFAVSVRSDNLFPAYTKELEFIFSDRCQDDL